MAAVLAVGCGDGGGPSGPEPTDLDPANLGTVQCRVSEGEMSCGSEGSGVGDGVAAVKTTTVGGQNHFVILSGSVTNDVDSGDDIWAADVTVKNLMVQPMGTENSDGSAPSGAEDIKVFFEDGPTGSDGGDCTTVEVANHDGTGNFTGINQKFYQYDKGTHYTGTLDTDQTTSIKNWQFNVNNGCSFFDFTVFVTANLPHENTVFRSADRTTWTGVDSIFLNHRGMWGVSEHEVWVSSDRGEIVHTTDGGVNWTGQRTGRHSPLNGLWGADASNLWAVGNTGWFDTNWSHRKKITIDNTKVAGDLTDFPVLVSITDADIQAAAQADGDDILFTDTNGTKQLDHEIEKWDSGTGELVAWVRVPSVPSGSDEVLYVYYGNGSAANQENVTGVWSNGYEAVYHLHDDLTDATANARDGTNSGSADAAGLIADAQDFEFDDKDHIDIGTWNVSGQAITLQAWVNYESFNDNDARTISKANGGFENDHVFLLGENFDGCLRMRLKTGTDDATGTTTVENSGCAKMNTGTWYLTAATYDGSTMRVLRDGSEEASDSKSGSIRENTWDIRIGKNPADATKGAIDALVDEVRVSSAARSSAWLTTEFNNQSSPGTFYSVGAEESPDAVILHTTDGWASWSEETSNAGEHLRDVFGVSTSDVWAVGDGGVITHYNGTSWSSQTSGTAFDLHGVWAASSSEAWAVGGGGTVLHTTSGGSSWSSETTPVSSTLLGVWGSGADDVWAVGNDGVILHRTGGSWSEHTDSGLTIQHLQDVSGTGPSDVFAVGNSGVMLHYDGTSWMELASRAESEKLWRVSTLIAQDDGKPQAYFAGTIYTIRELDRDTNTTPN